MPSRRRLRTRTSGTGRGVLSDAIGRCSNTAQHATNVSAALQEPESTGVRNASCSGGIGEAQAPWEDKPQKLRVELKTRRIEAVAQQNTFATGGRHHCVAAPYAISSLLHSGE